MAMLSLKNHTELLSPSSIPIPFPHTALSSFSSCTPGKCISLNPRIRTRASQPIRRRFGPVTCSYASVVGVDGGGNNAVNRMIGCGLQMQMNFFIQDMLGVVKKGVADLKKGATDAQKAAHKEKKRKDSTALYLICQSVDPEAFEKIATAETAKDAWEILKKAYYDNDSIRSNCLEIERNMSMVSNETIEVIGQNFSITNLSSDESVQSNCLENSNLFPDESIQSNCLENSNLFPDESIQSNWLEIERNTSMVPKETIEVIAQNIGITNLSPDESIQSNFLEIERNTSVVPKETIEEIARSIGITNLSPNVALALAPNLEGHIREIMQESIKCMRHSMRTFLTADDVDTALALRNYEPKHGFTSSGPLRFKRAVGHKNLLYIDDKAVDLKDLVEAALPKAPLATSIASHWLAIEGVQPAIPENAPVHLEAPGEIRISENMEDGLSVDVKLPVKHVITRELQLYYEKITELCLNKADSIPFRRALVSLATDPGLHPLAPYVTCFIAEEVARNLNNFNILFALMRVVRSLVQNPHIHIELYLHQLMPPIITCIVAKRIGSRLSDNHWELRDYSANLVALICKRFGHMYHNLQPRVTKTFIHSFLDPTKALPQHYGAIKGIAALGSRLVRLLILPNLEPYLYLLEPEMQLETQKNEIKRQQAWQVYGALLFAVGQVLQEMVKRGNGKAMTSMPSNRKASTDNLMQQQQQPPLTKIPTDGQQVIPMNSMSVDNMQGSTSGFSTMMGVPNVGMSSMGCQLSNDNTAGRDVGGLQWKASNILAQAWKDDIYAEQLLPPLFELFGESLLPFIPKPEAGIFL